MFFRELITEMANTILEGEEAQLAVFLPTFSASLASSNVSAQTQHPGEWIYSFIRSQSRKGHNAIHQLGGILGDVALVEVSPPNYHPYGLSFYAHYNDGSSKLIRIWFTKDRIFVANGTKPKDIKSFKHTEPGKGLSVIGKQILWGGEGLKAVYRSLANPKPILAIKRLGHWG